MAAASGLLLLCRGETLPLAPALCVKQEVGGENAVLRSRTNT